MALFCAAIRRDSVSFLRFPFLCDVHLFSCGISLVSLWKYPYSCVSSHFFFFGFLVIFVPLMLVMSVFFLVAVVSLPSCTKDLLRASPLWSPGLFSVFELILIVLWSGWSRFFLWSTVVPGVFPRLLGTVLRASTTTWITIPFKFHFFSAFWQFSGKV